MRKPRATAALAKKLLSIRLWKGMSQSEILREVFPDAAANLRSTVSQWERTCREPSRQTLIRYARLARISLEELLIDDRSLPAHIIEASEGFESDIRVKRYSKRN